MSCSNCKRKKEFQKEIIENNKNTPKFIIIFVILLTILSIYGMISLVFDLSNLIKWIF